MKSARSRAGLTKATRRISHMLQDLIVNLIGGVGLILLGMRLMTDGLKMAAGQALRRLLGRWTKTPLRGGGLQSPPTRGRGLKRQNKARRGRAK